MKNWIAAFAFILLFSGCSFLGSPNSTDLSQSASTLRYSVEVISRNPSFEATGSGTSVYNDSKGYSYILTCDHVIAGTGSVVTVSYAGKSYHAYVVSAVPSQDLAILSVKANIPTAPLFKGKTTAGTQELVVGYPLGEGLVITQGYFSNEVPSNHYKTLNKEGAIADPPLMGFGSASAWPGNSGGGVFALEHGRWSLVGVTSDIDAILSHPIEGLGIPYVQLTPTLSHYIPLRYAMPLLSSVEKSLHGQSS